MRSILLAGVALVGVSAFISQARADGMAPTVFPETSTPGKLNGAAPNSVSINIGFQQLTAIMAESGTGATGTNSRAFPQLLNWFHIFPSADYVSPSGIHFGTNAEIRNDNSGQGGGNFGGAGGNALYVHSAVSYVSSDTFGKFAVGTPNGALDDLGVGTGDDFGDGLFYSWYGPPNAPTFAMADSYDGDTPRQKLAYETPSFAGFKFGLSYQPTDAPLDHSTALTTGNPGAPGAYAHVQGLARNRIEAALQFSKTFGAFGLKADVGYAESGVENSPGGQHFQNVSYFNGGAVLTFAGIEAEGSVSTGKFGVTTAQSPGAPNLSGAKDTTVYIAGLGYNMGPFGIGVVYYGMNYDGFGAPGTAVAGAPLVGTRVSGEGLGASYVAGPGVTLQFDAYTYETTLSGVGKTHGNIVALASQFAF